MKFVTEYRDADRIRSLAARISRIAGGRECCLMEVCGTHTMAIARFGLRALLPPSIRLISGPGCPVCVTPNDYLDRAMALARISGAITCTFGDLMRVPGSCSSLERERAAGCDIRPVYSALDALDLARRERTRDVIFLGVGFETTAPTIAAAIKTACSEGLKNFSVLAGCRLIPPALEALLSGPVKIDGMILPGHVSSIIGANAYRGILRHHRVGGVVSGFEPIDLLDAIARLAAQIAADDPRVENAYERAVSDDGNTRALDLMNEIFEPCDSIWRGLGLIKGTGLGIRSKFRAHDAAARYNVSVPPSEEPAGCICGRILTGMSVPRECPLFKGACTPEHPVGACMVSSEGTCAAAAKYDS